MSAAILPPSKTQYLTVPETAKDKASLKSFDKAEVAKVRLLLPVTFTRGASCGSRGQLGTVRAPEGVAVG